ncbi:helicase carboxy-terminal domain protein, partial (macronuclear) [Tetrahymena thermophila SB210]
RIVWILFNFLLCKQIYKRLQIKEKQMKYSLSQSGKPRYQSQSQQNTLYQQKVTIQCISFNEILIRTRNEETWNILKTIMDKQQNIVMPIKGGYGGWKTQIKNQKIIHDLIRQSNIRVETMPVQYSNLFKEFNFYKFMESISQGQADVNPFSQNNQQIKRNFDVLPESIKQSLFKFQKTGIEFGIQRNCRLLIGDEMGVGKTLQALCIAYIYKDQWPLLIICPSCLRFTIKQEIVNWFSEYIDPSLIQVVSKGSDQLLKKAEIVIISFDVVNNLSEVIQIKKFQTCIIDEAHYLKSLDSQRSKTIVPLVERMKNVILLTGTPALSRPKELFNILKIIRPDIFNDFKIFAYRYCNPRLNKIVNCINYDGCDNELELNFILSERIMIRRLKEQILPDLPSKRRKKILIEIPQGSKNKINKAVKTANEKLFQIYLAKQMESQYLDDEFQNLKEEQENQDQMKRTFNFVYQETGLAKLDAVKEYLEDLMDSQVKLIIFAHHQQVLDRIEKMVKCDFRRQYIRIDGNVKQEERVDLVNQFQNNTKTTVAILSLQAASHGITLTASSHVIFAELYPTPAVMLQAEDRSHRINQNNNVLCHYLIGKDTVDEDIFNLLMQKYKVTSSILDGQRKDLQIDEFQVFQYDQDKMQNSQIELLDEKNKIEQNSNQQIIEEPLQPDKIVQNDKENQNNLINQSQLNNLSSQDTIFKDRTNQSNSLHLFSDFNTHQEQVRLKKEQDLLINNQEVVSSQTFKQSLSIQENSNGIIFEILDNNDTDINIQMLSELFNQKTQSYQENDMDNNQDSLIQNNEEIKQNILINTQKQLQKDQVNNFQFIFDAIDEIQTDSEVENQINSANIVEKIEQKKESKLLQNVKNYFQSQSEDSSFENQDAESCDGSQFQEISTEKIGFQEEKQIYQGSSIIDLFAFKRNQNQISNYSFDDLNESTQTIQKQQINQNTNKSNILVSSDKEIIEIEPFQSQIQAQKIKNEQSNQEKEIIQQNLAEDRIQQKTIFDSQKQNSINQFENNQNCKQQHQNCQTNMYNNQKNKNIIAIKSESQVCQTQCQAQGKISKIIQPEISGIEQSQALQQQINKNSYENKIENQQIRNTQTYQNGNQNSKELKNLCNAQSILLKNTQNQIENIPSVGFSTKQDSLGNQVTEKNDPLNEQQMNNLSIEEQFNQQVQIEINKEQNDFQNQQSPNNSMKKQNSNTSILFLNQKVTENQLNQSTCTSQADFQIQKNLKTLDENLNDKKDQRLNNIQCFPQKEEEIPLNINTSNQNKKISSQLNIIYADTDDSNNSDESDDDINFEIQLAQKFKNQTKQEVINQPSINGPNELKQNQINQAQTQQNSNSDNLSTQYTAQSIYLNEKNQRNSCQTQKKLQKSPPQQQQIQSLQKANQQNSVTSESYEKKQKIQQNFVKLDELSGNNFCYNQSTQGKVESMLEKNNINRNNQTQIGQNFSIITQTEQQFQQKRKREQFENQIFSSQSDSDQQTEKDIMKLKSKQLQSKRK